MNKIEYIEFCKEMAEQEPDIVNDFLSKTRVVWTRLIEYDGTTREMLRLRPRITLADGVSLSVQASDVHYCAPRSNNGPYTHVEVGFIVPSGTQVSSLAKELTTFNKNKPRGEFADLDTMNGPEYSDAVYGLVPVTLLNRLIIQHGMFIDIEGEWAETPSLEYYVHTTTSHACKK